MELRVRKRFEIHTTHTNDQILIVDHAFIDFRNPDHTVFTTLTSWEKRVTGQRVCERVIELIELLSAESRVFKLCYSKVEAAPMILLTIYQIIKSAKNAPLCTAHPFSQKEAMKA